MDKQRLYSVMALRGDRQRDLAEWLHISEARLNAKINSYRGAEFKQSEIIGIKDRYHLTAAEVDQIFFGQAAS